MDVGLDVLSDVRLDVKLDCNTIMQDFICSRKRHRFHYKVQYNILPKH